ncbi:hypothetical protein ACN38_g11679 [Penicillium nordicum]|uniref:Uncharacterized protein n=1 Tax=Penicillium nordicum TaxID=229535 RepID=A0A0M8NRZ6_9EURO|nr:hypothetical protein ACN38_g11679 [Penicillium nordicum]
MGVGNLDKTSEQVGFPVLEKRMAEFFDVSLEQPQFTLQSDCIGLQLCESSFDLLVEGKFHTVDVFPMQQYLETTFIIPRII